jgi:acetyl-CoA carboxylase carboxyl transferase subunit beta
MTDVASQAPAATSDWGICRGCRDLVYGKRLRRNLYVCPECDRHEPVSAEERLRQLLDPGSIEPLDLVATTADPLNFTDTVPYPQRVAKARRATGVDEAVRCARGTVQGHPLIVAAMDFRFLGGSLGSAVGELITLAAETALADRTPLLIVTASGGARMQEGALSLMQMAKTSQALAELDEAGVLTISLVTDPTYGGTAASFATLTDVIMAEPGARLGFAGPRVIEQTIRRPLPPGFQTAEFLLEHGLIDLVRPRRELRPALANLLALVAAPAPAPVDADVLVRDPEELPARDAWQAVKEARALDRPTTMDYVARLLHGFVELRGDRLGADCPAIVGGVGRLDGRPVLVVGHRKGHTPAEMLAVNHGMASPAGYRKSARLMRLAAKLGLPVVTLVDTPGAYPGLEAEEHGQAIAVAESIRLMSTLPVPVVSVVTGEGGSGGALALAVANRVFLCANAVYSVISPEGCAAILWKDAGQAATAARALRLDARELLRLGVVDAVVPEPPGGAGADPPAAAENLRRAVTRALDELSGLSARQLVAERRARFRRFGTPETLVATPAAGPAPLVAPVAAGKGGPR